MLISETEFDKNVNEMIFVEKMIFSVRFKKFIPQRCSICIIIDNISTFVYYGIKVIFVQRTRELDPLKRE